MGPLWIVDGSTRGTVSVGYFPFLISTSYTISLSPSPFVSFPGLTSTHAVYPMLLRSRAGLYIRRGIASSKQRPVETSLLDQDT